MKFAIISKGDEKSDELMSKIKNHLVAFELIHDPKDPNIVITVGGDGTLLHAFHKYLDRLDETAFVGVHTGHLGFYADWKPDEIESLVLHIGKRPFNIIEYPLLEVSINSSENQERFLALNECAVKTSSGSLVMNLEIKGELFETFRGDGLCISTPSGSTAYNKALGGAIIHPSLPSLQISEMASINNRVYRTIGSPLILPQHQTCKLIPLNGADHQITIDHIAKMVKNVQSIQCRVADETIKFARFRSFPFWERVRESFITD